MNTLVHSSNDVVIAATIVDKAPDLAVHVSRWADGAKDELLQMIEREGLKMPTATTFKIGDENGERWLEIRAA